MRDMMQAGRQIQFLSGIFVKILWRRQREARRLLYKYVKIMQDRNRIHEPPLHDHQREEVHALSTIELLFFQRRPVSELDDKLRELDTLALQVHERPAQMMRLEGR